MKGRKERKIFENNLPTYESRFKRQFGLERLAAEDPNYTKFTHKKERTGGHH